MRKGEDGNSHCFFSISLTILKTSLFISSVPFRKHLLRADCGPSSVQESVGDLQGGARSSRHYFYLRGSPSERKTLPHSGKEIAGARYTLCFKQQSRMP